MEKKYAFSFIKQHLYSIVLLAFASSLQAQSWSHVGSPSPSLGHTHGTQPYSGEIFFSPQNELYLGFIGGTPGSNSYLTMKKWDGTAWIDIFADYQLNRESSTADFEVAPNGDVYVAYYFSYGINQKARVRKYSNGVWSFVGDSLNNGTQLLDLAISSNGDLWWLNNIGLYRFDTTANNWVSVNPGHAPLMNYTDGSIGFDTANNVYVAYGSGGSTHLRKFNGTVWTGVGSAVNNTSGQRTHLLMNNPDKPIVTYANISASAVVKEFDGTSWNDVGNTAQVPNVSVAYYSACQDTLGNPLLTSYDFDGIVYAYDGSNYIKLDSATVSGTYLKNEQILVNPLDNKKYLLVKENINDPTLFNYSVLEYTGITTGITEIPMSESVSIYPNPLSDLLTINLKDWKYDATVSLFDIQGRKILEQTFTGNLAYLNVENLEKGLYLLKVEGKEKRFATRVVVK